MFQNDKLKNIINQSASINSKSLILAEWNMNLPENIKMVGNYRYRPTESESIYKTLKSNFDLNDSGNFYKNATDADIEIDGGFTDSDTPQTFLTIKEKEKQLYSLESCFDKFRPRSGINKLRYFNNRFINNTNEYLAQRPRYYMSDKKDLFKYWTSYRTEGNIERGIAKKIVGGSNYIDDTAPFVVYKQPVPANRVVVKMQTNVGTIDLGPFYNQSGSFADPLYGNTNKTTPIKWKIQKLQGSIWSDIASFDTNSQRIDGSSVIKEDGYVELSYGLVIPKQYIPIFSYIGTFASEESLPDSSFIGAAYLTSESATSLGSFFIWTGEKYETFAVQYGWSLEDSTVSTASNFLQNFTNPEFYYDTNKNTTRYKEFEYLDGLRVVVETMNKFDSTFDLIELSPRLKADVSDMVIDYSINKVASDLGNSGLPVGQLLASTGSMNIFDNNQAFNDNNRGSIINRFLSKNVKFDIYEIIIDNNTDTYFIPIKTMYSDSIPKSNIQNSTVNLELRDLYFYFESMSAPELLLTNASVTYIISILLDYIGFSNYSFKKLDDENELIVPFFFCNSDKTIAEVLNDIAVSSQTSMFFDEYNNFILMSKGYMLPSINERATDSILTGNVDFDIDQLPNILNISSVDKKVFNNGKINYTTRYIQRTLGSLQQASLIDKEKTWVYKPSLLWEVSGTENLKSTNESAGRMSTHILSAMPLNSNLTSNPPTVENNIVINNVMDFGENIYWITRYNGYFYSNGEIIKYDAVEFNIPRIGNVWISSSQEYEKYFGSLPFNGKMYPTGLVRIYTEPDYELVSGITRLKKGSINKHGRAQFGTQITEHKAGLNSYWTSNDNVNGCNMYSEYIFTDKQLDKTVVVGNAGLSKEISKQMSRSGIIKNFMTSSYTSEYSNKEVLPNQSGAIQSSALVLTGPTFKETEKALDYINYVHKPLTDKFKHFGSRLRIVGKIENNEVRGQTPVGSTTYYVVPGTDPSQNISVGGGSGGIGVMMNPTTNVGYYFEVVALTDRNSDQYAEGTNISNLLFYKIGKDQSSEEKAVPVMLWSGLGNILVDDGNFTGQYRLNGEANPTVYDIAVEYQDIGSTRKFFLYINNTIVGTVVDNEPLPIYNNMCLFARGSSKIMFENIFAIASNYSQNTSDTLDLPFNQIFDNQEINTNDSFRKYAMSSVVQSTYIAGLSPSQPPSYKMYFDEFGSIMRECEYFNVKYDKAYPALYAKISPTFNKIKGYTVSGFNANPYSAEFLIFNATDTALSLDETSGNYLRIQGVAFTQSTTHSLTVDDYYSEQSSKSEIQYFEDGVIRSPQDSKNKYNEIKLSRSTYGNNEFTLDAQYIQTQDDAKELMSWITDKIIKPRKSIGVEIFADPTIQLGDVVEIYHREQGKFDFVSDGMSRFVVYNISYSKSSVGPSMNIYLVEVPNG